MLSTKIEIMDFLVSLFHSTPPVQNLQTINLHIYTHNALKLIVLWPGPVVSEDRASSRPLIGPISPPLVSLFVLMKAPAILSNTCFWIGWTHSSPHSPKYNITLQMKPKSKDKASALKSDCVREKEKDWQNEDEMESRHRQRVCVGSKLWGMKDARWKIRSERASHGHTRRAMSVTGPQKEQRLFKRWLWHASLRASAFHALSRPANQWAYCCDVWEQRFMGVRVLQCLATEALKLLLLIIKDCCRTHSHSASLSLFILPVYRRKQFANGCSNLVIYCCQRYASSKTH